MSENKNHNKSKIQQVLDLVIELNLKFQLMSQQMLGIEKRSDGHEGLITKLTNRIEGLEKDFIKHETEHETNEKSNDKSKKNNFRWFEVITAIGVLFLMIMEFIK